MLSVGSVSCVKYHRRIKKTLSKRRIAPTLKNVRAKLRDVDLFIKTISNAIPTVIDTIVNTAAQPISYFFIKLIPALISEDDSGVILSNPLKVLHRKLIEAFPVAVIEAVQGGFVPKEKGELVILYRYGGFPRAPFGSRARGKPRV